MRTNTARSPASAGEDGGDGVDTFENGLLAKRMDQIACREERSGKNGNREVKLVARTILKSPTHPWKQIERLGKMCEYDNTEAARAE